MAVSAMLPRLRATVAGLAARMKAAMSAAVVPQRRFTAR